MMLRPCVAVSSDLESRIPAGDGMGWDGMGWDGRQASRLSQTAGDAKEGGLNPFMLI